MRKIPLSSLFKVWRANYQDEVYYVTVVTYSSVSLHKD